MIFINNLNRTIYNYYILWFMMDGNCCWFEGQFGATGPKFLFMFDSFLKINDKLLRRFNCSMIHFYMHVKKQYSNNNDKIRKNIK
jgi:hypothetical protein